MDLTIREWFSIQRARNPGRAILFRIMLFNVLFFLAAALVISNLSLSGTEKMGFLEAAYYTVTMILDAGCIQFVIEDIGSSGVVTAIICLVVILIGMVSFSGAVIGYFTNFISSFIENTHAGSGKLHISRHLVILNWNTRGSEIVNDLLYCEGIQRVVILSDVQKDKVEKEISERLADTVARENREIYDSVAGRGLLKRIRYFWKHRLQNNVVFLVREGNVYSSKQLRDISLERARAVIILNRETGKAEGTTEEQTLYEKYDQGNAQTIKTLMLVSDITAAEESDDNQRIIVEVMDNWTWDLVEQIINYKQVDGKCNIIPIRVNQVLGQILSQFSLMPELNLAYKELFSNKGATFYVEEKDVEDDLTYIDSYLQDHCDAVPLTSMVTGEKKYFFYSAEKQTDIGKKEQYCSSGYSVKLNREYWIERKYVIILGHNSRCRDIMQGFCAFRDEWNYAEPGREILQIIVIDDQKSLEEMNFYREYPFVIETVAASVYEETLICDTIERFIAGNDEDTSILILSDDNATAENTDSYALASLVYVQEIVTRKKKADPGFDTESIDIIVEIIDPKHYDIVNSYSVNNVIISNRYISKMITQIGEKEAIFEFYADILTFEAAVEDVFVSKEIYSKKVSSFFDELPGECTEAELIRAVWKASADPDIPAEERHPALALGYVKPGGQIVFFGKGQSGKTVRLEKRDKLIVFSNH